MTDQLYCPTCGPDWQGAYDMNHRCVKCGDPLRAEKVMERLKAVEEERDVMKRDRDNYKGSLEVIREGYKRINEERDALAAHVVNSNADKLAAAHNIRVKCTDDAQLLGVADMLERSAGESPDAVIARLKAEWQAEALEQLIYEGRDAREAETVRAFARNRMRALLKKALESQ